jgi:hypothetical protein
MQKRTRSGYANEVCSREGWIPLGAPQCKFKLAPVTRRGGFFIFWRGQVRIAIYELRREGDGFVIDERRLVAVITIEDGKRGFRFRDKRREKTLRALFENPLVSFVAGGKTPDGAHWDAATTYPAWSQEAIEQIIGDRLRSYNLGGIVTHDSARETEE